MASVIASRQTRTVTAPPICELEPRPCCSTSEIGSRENSWHWVRDVSLRKDPHRNREGNGIQILATMRSLAIKTLRLDGIRSITERIAEASHDTKGLPGLLKS